MIIVFRILVIEFLIGASACALPFFCVLSVVLEEVRNKIYMNKEKELSFKLNECILKCHVTGNLYITLIIFPRINYGITLHSLYSKNALTEIILLYITLS